MAAGLVAHRLRELLHVVVGGRDVGDRLMVGPVPAGSGVAGGVQDHDDDRLGEIHSLNLTGIFKDLFAVAVDPGAIAFTLIP